MKIQNPKRQKRNETITTYWICTNYEWICIGPRASDLKLACASLRNRGIKITRCEKRSTVIRNSRWEGTTASTIS